MKHIAKLIKNLEYCKRPFKIFQFFSLFLKFRVCGGYRAGVLGMASIKKISPHTCEGIDLFFLANGTERYRSLSNATAPDPAEASNIFQASIISRRIFRPMQIRLRTVPAGISSKAEISGCV